MKPQTAKQINDAQTGMVYIGEPIPFGDGLKRSMKFKKLGKAHFIVQHEDYVTCDITLANPLPDNCRTVTINEIKFRRVL